MAAKTANSGKRKAARASIILLAIILLGEVGCYRETSIIGEENVKNDKALARTVSMMRNGEGANTQYRILFYGQSITSHKWTDIAASNIRKKYPKVNFRFANLAIGGNGAALLRRAVERDIDAFYPDLVVFHDYGGQQDYEDIVKAIRSRSAAEVILQTDHLRAMPEPVCPVGLNLRFETPPGCRGRLWLHQNDWDDYMSGAIIPTIAAQYGAAVDPRRTGWNNYLIQNGLAPSQLLEDGLHPNETGWRLAATLFTSFFNRTIKYAKPASQSLSKIVSLPKGSISNVKFLGNRLELITSHPLQGMIKFSVDGVTSEKIPGCWITSRVTSVPWIQEWPALRQVNVSPERLETDIWTIELDKFDKQLKNFNFRLYSKLHGYDGQGNASSNFVSNSGFIKINSDDWVLNSAMVVRPVPVPDTLKVYWSRHNVCGYKSDDRTKVSAFEYHYIVATGLEKSKHLATIELSSENSNTSMSVISYNPPL